MKRLTALQRQIASVMVRCESTEDMVAVGESELDDVMNEKGNQVGKSSECPSGSDSQLLTR